MDQFLLTFLNRFLASPGLDAAAITLSTVGLAVFPALAAALLFSPRQRRVGAVMLAAQVAALGACLVLQYLVLRPRPSDVRLTLGPSNFPSYPSGHAAVAFAAAVVIWLAFRPRLGLPAVALALLISLSRVYLGLHYPSDVFAGAVLGAGLGAAAYGLLASCARGPHAWRWLLWPQLALILLASQMAYLDLLPRRFLAWPWSDKVLHFLLFGLVAFWLQPWLAGTRLARVGRLPVAVALPLAVAAMDEFAQRFSPLRTFDLLDLASDLAGLLIFFGLAVVVTKLVSARRRWKPVSL
jgi:undecaprenyl-diphosphatase